MVATVQGAATDAEGEKAVARCGGCAGVAQCCGSRGTADDEVRRSVRGVADPACYATVAEVSDFHHTRFHSRGAAVGIEAAQANDTRPCACEVELHVRNTG